MFHNPFIKFSIISNLDQKTRRSGASSADCMATPSTVLNFSFVCLTQSRLKNEDELENKPISIALDGDP